MKCKVSYTMDGNSKVHTWRGTWDSDQVIAEKKAFLRDIHHFHLFRTDENLMTGEIVFHATRFSTPRRPSAKYIVFTFTPVSE